MNYAVSQSGSFVASGELGGGKMRSFSGSSQTFTISTQGDSTDEPNGSVTVTLEDGTGYTLGTASSATVTVRDNDVSPPPPPPPPPTPTATPEPTEPVINLPPSFTDGDSALRSVTENSEAGSNVGEPVAAIDPEATAITYTLGGVDAELFEIDSSTGQITVGEGATLDFETTESYEVRVDVRDESNGRDSISVTISVTNVNEPGAVSLSSKEAAFGKELTATLTDPDGGITDVSWNWQWSSDGAEWFTIPGSRNASYTPSHSDGGVMLRATVTYSDAAGSASLESEATQVLPDPPMPTQVPPTAASTPTQVPPTTPEEEGGFPAWLIVIMVIAVAAIAVAGVLVIRSRR